MHVCHMLQAVIHLHCGQLGGQLSQLQLQELVLDLRSIHLPLPMKLELSAVCLGRGPQQAGHEMNATLLMRMSSCTAHICCSSTLFSAAASS